MIEPAAPSALLDRLAQAASATPEQLARLREILSRPEFQTAAGGPGLEEVLAPIRVAIVAFLLNLARAIWPGLEDAGDLPRVLGVTTAVLVSGAALIVFLRTARGSLAAEAALADAGPGRTPSAGEELALAQHYAAAGELRLAVHHRYVAVLRRLDERGVLRFQPAMTNREHLGHAAARPGLAATLEPLVTAFDRLWYGQAACSPAEYEAFSALADRAWQAA